MVKTVLKLALISVVGLLVACASDSDSAPPADASISGIITAAPVNGADVSVVDANGNVVAGPVKTKATGQYTLSIPNGSLGQDLIIKSTGGTFTDEATGIKDVPAGEMFAYASANSLSNGATVCATPGSTIIADLVMNHNKTLVQAQEAFTNAFGYTPDMSVTPADATTAPATDETDASTLAGFRAGAFSQLAMDLGLSQDNQFDLFAALAQDLSDDKLDGVDASGPVDIGATGSTLEADIQNRFAMALVNFSNNANNLTALNDAQIGNLPFGKIAFTTDDVNNTSTYQIEYKPLSMMDPMEGKSTFQIHVTDRVSGDDITGQAPMLMPMMNMAAHHHSTPMPVPAVSEDGNGLYTVTLYYLMPSQMMDGTSMGYWDLKLTVDGEEAHFYPAVMMAMGDTPKVVLKGLFDLDPAIGDTIAGMLGDMSRNYILFNESLTAGMGSVYKFKMFIAAMESMMSYPPVFVSTVLNASNPDSDYVLTVNTMTVEVSTVAVPTVNDWTTANEDPLGSGYWSAPSLTGLVDGTEGQIHVRLFINGVLKTTDGKAPSGTNEYTTYTVTPGGM